MKYYLDKTEINNDAFIFLREHEVSNVYYIVISKQPHWRKPYIKSLKTSDKEVAVKNATKEYNSVMEQQRVVQATLFNDEDIQRATTQAGIGKLGEDRFAGLMMVKGYEVYKPDIDLWGRDLVLFKDDIWMPTQVKTAIKSNNQWSFTTKHTGNHKIKYKEVCTHMALIHILENHIWFIPTDKIPDVDSMAHSKLKKYLDGYEVKL